MAIYNKKVLFSQTFAQKCKKKYKTKKFSHEKLPQKKPIPKSNAQNWTKVTFFFGHPALWGQGGKSLPLSEFSIFGHIWVQEVFTYEKDQKEIIF